MSQLHQQIHQWLHQWLITLFISLLFSISFILPVQAEPTAQQAFQSGVSAFQQQDYAAAVEQFDQAIQLDPHYTAAYSDRCLTHLTLEHYAAALNDCTQALEFHPNPASIIETYLNRGLAYYRTGAFPEAIADFTQVLQIKPHDYRAYYNRGLAETARGLAEPSVEFHRAALVDYGQALRQASPLDRPTLAEIYNDRGLTQLFLEDVQGAIADFSQAIQFSATDARFYYNRGCTYHHKGNKFAALEDFDKALSLDPSHAQAYLSRGILWQEMGDIGEAIADLQQAADAFYHQGAETNYQRVLQLIQRLQVQMNANAFG